MLAQYLKNVWSHIIDSYSDPNYQRIQLICPHVSRILEKGLPWYIRSCILRTRHKAKLLSRYCKYSFNPTQCKVYTQRGKKHSAISQVKKLDTFKRSKNRHYLEIGVSWENSSLWIYIMLLPSKSLTKDYL